MIEILDGIIVCDAISLEIDVWLNCYMQRVCVFELLNLTLKDLNIKMGFIKVMEKETMRE